MSAPMRLVVLVSGNGSNLQAILDACESGILAAEVVAVVSNKHSVKALERAESAGVPAVVVSAVAGETRAEYDTRLTSVVSSFMPDFVVLAGLLYWRFWHYCLFSSKSNCLASTGNYDSGNYKWIDYLNNFGNIHFVSPNGIKYSV